MLSIQTALVAQSWCRVMERAGTSESDSPGLASCRPGGFGRLLDIPSPNIDTRGCREDAERTDCKCFARSSHAECSVDASIVLSRASSMAGCWGHKDKIKQFLILRNRKLGSWR